MFVLNLNKKPVESHVIFTPLFRMGMVIIPGIFPFCVYILLRLKKRLRADLISHIIQLKKASKFSIIFNKLRMLKREGESRRGFEKKITRTAFTLEIVILL